jgi:hypothetical protein
MEELLREGHVYMNTVSYFARLEDSSVRHDADEGTASWRQAQGATFRVLRGDEWRTLGTLRDTIRLRGDALLAANLYCLHGLTRVHCEQDFRLNLLGFGESYVLFLDADEFFRRLQLAANAAGHKVEWHPVEYVDRGTYNGPMGLFRKFSEYAAQREVRVGLSPGCPGPLSLRLGNLADIAIMGRSDDVLRLEPKQAG